MVLILRIRQLMHLLLFAPFVKYAPVILKLNISISKLSEKDESSPPYEKGKKQEAQSQSKIKRQRINRAALLEGNLNPPTVQSSIFLQATGFHIPWKPFNYSEPELPLQSSKNTSGTTKCSGGALRYKNTAHATITPTAPLSCVVFATISIFRMTDTKTYYDAAMSPSVNPKVVGFVTSTRSTSGMRPQEESAELEIVPLHAEYAPQILDVLDLTLTPSPSARISILSSANIVLSSALHPTPTIGLVAKEAINSTVVLSISEPTPSYAGGEVPFPPPPPNSNDPIITPPPSQSDSNSFVGGQIPSPTTLLTIPTSATGRPLPTPLSAQASLSNSRSIPNGALAGIVIGGVAVFCGIFYLLIRFCIAPRYADAIGNTKNSGNATGKITSNSQSNPLVVHGSGTENHSLKQQILSKIEKIVPPKFGMCTCSRCWKEKESVEDLQYPAELASRDKTKHLPKFGMCTCSSCWKEKEKVDDAPCLGHIRRQPYRTSLLSSPLVDDDTSGDDIQQNIPPHALHPSASPNRSPPHSSSSIPPHRLHLTASPNSLPPRSSSAPSTILGLATIPPYTPNIEGVWAGGIGIASSKTMDQQSICANSEHSVKMLPGYERFFSRRLPFLPVVDGKVSVRDLRVAGFSAEEYGGVSDGGGHKVKLEDVVESRRRSSTSDVNSMWKGKGKEII